VTNKPEDDKGQTTTNHQAEDENKAVTNKQTEDNGETRKKQKMKTKL
jgi:hypothetical protein